MHHHARPVVTFWLLLLCAAVFASPRGHAVAQSSAAQGTPVAPSITIEETAVVPEPVAVLDANSPVSAPIQASSEGPATPTATATISPPPENEPTQEITAAAAVAPTESTAPPDTPITFDVALRLDRMVFSPITPADAPTFSIGTISLSYTGAPLTGDWAVDLIFSDFTPSRTGPAVPVSHLSLVDVSGQNDMSGSQTDGVMTLVFAAGIDQPANGAITISVRLDVPNPVAGAVYRSQVTATARSMSAE